MTARTWMLAGVLMVLGGCTAAERAPQAREQTTETAGAAGPFIPGALQPYPGVLVSGQPTEAQLRQAKEQGYGLVINLRPEGEPGALPNEAELVRELGMELVELPIAGPQDLTPQNVERFAAALAQAKGRPVLVHCSSGNRVGALFALKAHQLDGKSPEQALEEGRRAGLTKLEPEVRARLEAQD